MFCSFVTSAPSILLGTGDIMKSLRNLLIETLEVVKKGERNTDNKRNSLISCVSHMPALNQEL